MSKQAIVILLSEALPEEVIIQLGTSLQEIVENVVIKEFDENSIAKALLDRAVLKDTNVIVTEHTQDEGKTSLEQAVIYIYGRYRDDLINQNVLGFSFSLKKDYSDAKGREAFNPSYVTTEDTALINAVNIIADASTIPGAITTKYKITKSIRNAIHYIRNNC